LGPSIERVRQAAQRLQDVAYVTPLERNDYYSAQYN